MTSDPAGEDALRIGDEDRVAAIEELSRHYAAGRVDQQEFDERSAAVYEARTRGELRPVFADLPTGPGTAPGAAPGPRPVPGPGAGSAEVAPAASTEPATRGRSGRTRASVMGLCSAVAVATFFVLSHFDIDGAGMVFLFVPILGALVYGPERGRVREERLERRDRRRDRRDLH